MRASLLASILILSITAPAVVSLRATAGAHVSAVPCYVPSPHGKPLQIMHRVKPEWLDLYQLYRPFFAGQLFMVTDSLQYPPDEVERYTQVDWVVCPEPNNRYVPCLGRIAARFAADGYSPPNRTCEVSTPVSGILVHHADMWVNPKLLLAAYDTSRPWLPEQGIVGMTYCAEGDTLLNDATQPWHDNSRALGLEVMKTLPLRPPGWSSTRLCFGHSDVYYVPEAVLGPYGAWAQAFAGVMHECATPTMVNMAATQLGVLPLATNCAGHCCAWLVNPVLRNLTCAHRIDLTSPELRQQMGDLLREYLL